MHFLDQSLVLEQFAKMHHFFESMHFLCHRSINFCLAPAKCEIVEILDSATKTKICKMSLTFCNCREISKNHWYTWKKIQCFHLTTEKKIKMSQIFKCSCFCGRIIMLKNRYWQAWNCQGFVKLKKKFLKNFQYHVFVALIVGDNESKI